MIVKHALLSVPDASGKITTRYFFEKYSYLCYQRKNKETILEYRLWDLEDNIRPTTHEELVAVTWRSYHPVREFKQKKEVIPKEKPKEKYIYMIESLILNECKEKKLPVTLFTVNGFAIRGVIANYDNNVIVLMDENNKTKMIYKNAVSTLETSQPLAAVKKITY